MHNKFAQFLLLCTSIYLGNISAFEFNFDPIDAVIPCHPKDVVTIDLVIKGIKENVKNIRRVVVVSERQLTDNAEWFDEREFPFTKQSIAYEIFKNEQEATEFISHPQTRIGWIFQQFLKVYSIFVIPNISSNVLIVDADTIFLRPVEFQDPITGAGLYNPGTENHPPYFEHLKRVLPTFKKVFNEYSGISHHMLFQRRVMRTLFDEIIKIHNRDPWKVFCDVVDKNHLFGSCMCVEYELYFNFVFARSNLVRLRHLQWDNIAFKDFERLKKYNYHFLSCHTYMT